MQSPIISVAHLLKTNLARGEALDATTLSAALDNAFGGTCAQGAWIWRDAYDVAELALVLFLQEFGPAITRTESKALRLLDRVTALMPSQTKRSEESQARDQFSTPPALGFIASAAACITPSDVIVEPSAGNGLLAAFVGRASLVLNELDPRRHEHLKAVFPNALQLNTNAENLADYLPAGVAPSVAIMNPPFTAAAAGVGNGLMTTARHIETALRALCPGGRLVAITGHNFNRQNADVRTFMDRVGQGASLRLSCRLPEAVFTRFGTRFATRLLVLDKIAGDQARETNAGSLADALDQVRLLPPRPACSPSSPVSSVVNRPSAARPPRRPMAKPLWNLAEAIEITYDQVSEQQPAATQDKVYEPWRPQSIKIDGAKAHPSDLVESAAMASVALPAPSYRPTLFSGLVAKGMPSAAQLEAVIHAGDAHGQFLETNYKIEDDGLKIVAQPEEGPETVRYRQGFFIADGTGVGKGCEGAAILLDNWLKGRKRHLWFSQSDQLIEDARRDWTGLGGHRAQIYSQNQFKPGQPIPLEEGILFSTYATLRRQDGEKSRLKQIVDWVGPDFDGVILFDEAHAMANAVTVKDDLFSKQASQQALAGLRLQYLLPKARVVYISATGATELSNLAYAFRLGLWSGGRFPWTDRSAFLSDMEKGGIAALEVICRDLKALGLYISRSLSFAGVEVSPLEHSLTDEQIRIYDAWADAFQVMHANLQAALEATNISVNGSTANRMAKAAALSAFESMKQRFFNHLISGMKGPTLLRSIEGDLERGEASIVQLVSTNEALLDRSLATIPAGEWNDLTIDLTPREAVMDYLDAAWPVQLNELVAGEGDDVHAEPVFDDAGNAVLSREAVRLRDDAMLKLAGLPPVPGLLDQILHHFGQDAVAEVTGRSRRLLKEQGRLFVTNRAAAANLAEGNAFMAGEKHILVFSGAGNTGRSFDADRGCGNTRLRNHYLPEAGWQATGAIQGLGRCHRSNQLQPPRLRPVTTDVKGEKRFISTIVRRLDSMGAITKGQRETGSNGLYSEKDNLESIYATSALRTFLFRIFKGEAQSISLLDFQDQTGLRIATNEGMFLDEQLPPIRRFLNRLLALRIAVQNQIFGEFMEIVGANVDAAMTAGTYQLGMETLKADSFQKIEERVLVDHGNGSSTNLVTVLRRDRTTPFDVDQLVEARESYCHFVTNLRSGGFAVVTPAPSRFMEDGSVVQQIRIYSPLSYVTRPKAWLQEAHVRELSRQEFDQGWRKQVLGLPEFTERRFHMITGLLLPVWKKLPGERPQVWRLETDEGERLLGRVVDEAAITGLLNAFGLVGETMPAAAIFESVYKNGSVIELNNQWQVRQSRIMGEIRIELIGPSDRDHASLKADGCFLEIINYRARCFVPANEAGQAALTTIADRYGVAGLRATG